jgi:putative protease
LGWKNSLPKILAPINSVEGGIKVVDAGADEVYCAVQIPEIKDFVLYRGPSSELPSYDDLGRVVKYAHAHNRRVDLVINQPYMVSAIEEPIRKHIHNCLDQGVDALIVGDFGVLSIIRRLGVKIPLIASTYMMSMNIEAVAFLEEQGFSRAILERHLKLEEIAKIVRSTRMEIEILVHGGGCSNINGSCYLYHYQFPELLNAMRESNKSTPCALPFSLLDLDGSLVAEDITVMDAFEYCSICKLPDLISTGVAGFKIEGRTGSVWYQEATTRVYRELLDLIASGRMEEYRRRLEELKNGVYFLPLPTNFYKLKELWCWQKRCYYSPLTHNPYRILLTWQTWTKQHFSWVQA